MKLTLVALRARHWSADGEAKTRYRMDSQVELIVGVALMVLGIILFVFSRRSKSKSVQVIASGGSIAVGGNNSGSINYNQPPQLAPTAAPAPAQHGSHALTWVAIAVELVGIGVTVWHAWHLAHA